MLRLSDPELQSVLTAAAPIPRHRRAAFLAEVSAALTELGNRRGDGSSHRAIVFIARKFFDAPNLDGADAA
jgi:hypothetical protein